MLAIGVLGGGIISRLLVKGVGALVKKITGSSTLTVNKNDLNNSSEVDYYLDNINQKYNTSTVQSQTTSTNVSVQTSQAAYDKYMSAYQEYVNCAQKNDQTGAKAAYDKYKTYLDLYQTLLKSGL